MSGFLAFAFMQAVQQAIPVVSDAPPELLWAGYDQCLSSEIDKRTHADLSPEAIFDASQSACAFWLDAYVEKIRRSVVLTNVDFDAEKAKVVSAMRDLAIPLISERQASAERNDPSQ